MCRARRTAPSRSRSIRHRRAPAWARRKIGRASARGCGSLSRGVAVTPPAASATPGPSGGTLTVNANGSISLTTPTTAGTYTFQYRIGNVQGTSDGTVTIQVNQAPTITSVGPANFSVGTNATYNITTTGTPTVNSITLTGCVLPA